MMIKKDIRAVVSGVILAVAGITVQAQPELKWLSENHNFGAFDEDNGKVFCEFVYVNTGDEPAVITAARSSCGCTAPQYSREAVAPGDTAAVIVSYDPKGRPGRFNKKVVIDTNTPKKRYTLHIEGVVIGSATSVAQRYPVDFGPLKLSHGAVMLGEVKKGRLKTVFCDAYNRSSDTIRPVVGDLPPYMDVDIKPEAVAPGEQTTMVFYMRSERCPQWGVVSDSITITPDAATPGKKHTLPVVAIVSEDFSRLTPGEMQKAPVSRLESDVLDFGEISRSGGQVVREVDLSNLGRNSLEVRRVYTADAGVSAQCGAKSVKKGKKAVIKVTVDPSAIAGTLLNGRISVITNDPVSPVRTIRVVGKII